MSWDINPGSTWKPLTDLKKKDIGRLYDARAKSSTREEREAVLRSMIHYPPEYETVFANLIRRSHRTFEDNGNDCRPANYKTECYKDFKHGLNEFQGGLFTDSGKPLRFTLKRRSPAAAIATSTSTSTTTSPQNHSSSDPLQPLNSNYILHMPDWKIKMFAHMIFYNKPDNEAKRQFIKKYLCVMEANDDVNLPGVVNEIIEHIVQIGDDLDKITAYLFSLKNLKEYGYSPYDAVHILYPFPFPAMYPNFRNARRNPSVHNLGGGKRGGMRRRQRRTTRKRRAN